MAFLTDLWLPILLSSIALFFCSFLAWAVFPHHKKDHAPAPDEEAMISAVRGLNLKPGRYLFPFCHNNAQHKDPEFIQKWKDGPAGMINIWPQVSMGRNMALTYLVFLITSLFIAYLARETLPNGADFARVFQVVGTAGIIAFCFSFIPNMIWFNGGTRAIFMCIIDGIAYGLVTGAIFAFLWPAGPVLGMPIIPGAQ